MSKVNYTLKLNNTGIKIKKEDLNKALFLTTEALHTDLVQSQTVPFKTGTMQNESTSVQQNSDKSKSSLVMNTPYARRLYYHPEYNFSKDNNPNAGAEWFETYVHGNKKDFVKDTYKNIIGG